MGQGMKCLGWELRDRERCWWSPASDCSWTSWILLVVPGLAVCSLLWLVTAAMSLLPELTGRAVAVRGRMKLLQCRERQCRLISATAFYTMIHSGWPITIIPDRFTNTTTLSAPSVLEIRVISLHRLRNCKKKRFEN